MAEILDEKPLTGGLKKDGSRMTIREYEKLGGYRGFKRALTELSPLEVCEEVLQSNLKGRGGAGFPTGLKWKFFPSTDEGPKYLVCNADEMEPGAFKDRFLLEGNPHLLVEGMLIAARALNTEKGFIFLRWAYKNAERCIERALAEAREAGYLGKNILGTDFSYDMRLHVSAGRYICGEETALLSSLEGGRAQPRAKPPRPNLSGLWGRPTLTNNAETFCNLPGILRHGPKWYLGLGLGEEGGTKIYGVSGRVNRPGSWELPMGTSMRQLIYEHAGGMQSGYFFRTALPGGASTAFVLPEHLDAPMDFEGMKPTGSRLGTGTVIVIDDRTCLVGAVHNLMTFFARESCGWCTPCREGLPWLRNILADLEAGAGQEGDVEILREHTVLLGPGRTFCFLAPGAMEPLMSALDHFEEDFREHVRLGRCPHGGAPAAPAEAAGRTGE